MSGRRRGRVCPCETACCCVRTELFLNRGTMTLRLRIVSDQRRSLAERSSATFTVEGGTIGRSADNDWVLPDPLRYVSAHHARVQFREGHFYLQDVSTNGVYVNDEMEPLAKRGSSGYRVTNGDVIRMGDYQIVAAVEAQQAQPEPAAAVPTSIHTLRTFGRSSEADIGAPLNLQELLVPAAETGPVLPVNAYGQAVDSAPVRALAEAYAPRPQPMQPTDANGADAHSLGERMARLAEAVAREPKNGAGAMSLADVHSGLRCFCRGAGIRTTGCRPRRKEGCCILPGGCSARRWSASRISTARAPTRATATVSRCSRRMRTTRGPRSPTPWSRTCWCSCSSATRAAASTRCNGCAKRSARQKLTRLAAAHATRAAFVEFLDRLDPAELEARFERAARRGKARSADKAQYWDLFTTFYRNLIEMPADHLPHTFVEAFAAAYREALKKPAS